MNASRSSTPRHPALPRLRTVVVVAAPWLWFAVRRRGGALDAVAVALPLVGAGSLLVLGAVAAMRRRLLPLVAGLSILTVCAVATFSPRIPRDGASPARPVRIAMANVYDANPVPGAAIVALAERDVDVLVTVEMGPGFWTQLGEATTFPYSLNDGELGVHSRYPVFLLAPQGLPRSRLLRVRVDAPGKSFVLYVTHALNPLRDSSSISDQRVFVRDIVQTAKDERRPVVIVGDFNMSDRSQNYRLMDAALSDAMRVGRIPASTYFGGWWPLLLIRIDHAFVTRDWCAAEGSTFTVPGSDHDGIQVAVGPCP